MKNFPQKSSKMTHPIAPLYTPLAGQFPVTTQMPWRKQCVTQVISYQSWVNSNCFSMFQKEQYKVYKKCNMNF